MPHLQPRHPGASPASLLLPLLHYTHARTRGAPRGAPWNIAALHCHSLSPGGHHSSLSPSRVWRRARGVTAQGHHSEAARETVLFTKSLFYVVYYGVLGGGSLVPRGKAWLALVSHGGSDLSSELAPVASPASGRTLRSLDTLALTPQGPALPRPVRVPHLGLIASF